MKYCFFCKTMKPLSQMLTAQVGLELTEPPDNKGQPQEVHLVHLEREPVRDICIDCLKTQPHFIGLLK